MTVADLTPYVGIMAFGLAVIGVFRNEQLRRQGSFELLRKAIELIEHRLAVIELRLIPLFRVMDDRLSAMFHQPSEAAWYTDHLIEKYQADPLSLTLDELEDLITYATNCYHLARLGQQGDHLPQADIAQLFLALLEGMRDLRALQEECARLAAPVKPQGHRWRQWPLVRGRARV